MHTLHHIPFVVALSLVVSLMPIGLAVRAPAGQPSRASAGPLPEISTPLRGQERHGPLVILRVRALVPEKAQLNDPAQATVRAVVLAIDEEIK